MIILKPLLENLHSHISDHEQLSANKDVQYWCYWSSSQLQPDPKCRFLQQSSWTGWISRLFLMLHFYFCFKSRLNFELHDDTTLRPAACRTQIIGGDSEVNEIKMEAGGCSWVKIKHPQFHMYYGRGWPQQQQLHQMEKITVFIGTSIDMKTFFPCSFKASVLTTCCSFSLLLMYNVGVCR